MARISSRTVASHCGKSRDPVATSLLRGVRDEGQGNVREVSRPACAQYQSGGTGHVGESRHFLTMFTTSPHLPTLPTPEVVGHGQHQLHEGPLHVLDVDRQLLGRHYAALEVAHSDTPDLGRDPDRVDPSEI